MARKASAPVIILVVLVLISLALAAGGFYLFQKERTKTRDLEQKLEEVNAKQKVSEAKLKESQKLISDMQLRLQEARLQIDTLSNDLEQEKTGRLEAISNIERLRVDLEEQKRSRLDLENKLSQAQDEARKTQAKLTELQSQKTELELKLKDLEAKSQNVELGSIVVSPETAVPQSEEKVAAVDEPWVEKKEKSAKIAGLEGKVLVINKDYNFAVINLGSKDGINLGDAFSIYHKNKYIGDVKVEKVHDSMSAAGFVYGDIKDKISEGDKVVQNVK